MGEERIAAAPLLLDPIRDSDAVLAIFQPSRGQSFRRSLLEASSLLCLSCCTSSAITILIVAYFCRRQLLSPFLSFSLSLRGLAGGPAEFNVHVAHKWTGSATGRPQYDKQ